MGRKRVAHKFINNVETYETQSFENTMLHDVTLHDVSDVMAHSSYLDWTVAA